MEKRKEYKKLLESYIELFKSDLLISWRTPTEYHTIERSLYNAMDTLLEKYFKKDEDKSLES